MKPAHFYTLPKIHKRLQNPPGRPIVSSNRCPTERISAYVDLHLKPLVSSLPSYIRDTKDLLSQLQALPPLPPGALVFTMDVTALYTNIPHEAGLAACAHVLESRPNQVPLTDDIILLACLVLELNAFTYENQHYLRVCGTAMGTRMAPAMLTSSWECWKKNMLATAPQGKTPLFCKRSLMMCFGIWLFGELEEALLAFFAHANKAHPSINFTYRFGTEVDFMDSSLSIRGDSISSDLYTKPTDTHQYLLPSSDHPPHVHKHLPYGLGIRLRAIVSDDTRLEHRLSELTAFFTARGYSKPAVEEQLDRVRATPRDRVLNCTKRSFGNQPHRPGLHLEHWLTGVLGIVERFLPHSAVK